MKKTIILLAFLFTLSAICNAQTTVNFNYKATYVAEGKDSLTFFVQEEGQIIAIDPSVIPMESEEFLPDLILLDLATEKLIIRGGQPGTEAEMCISMSLDSMLGQVNIPEGEEMEVIEFIEKEEPHTFQKSELPVYSATVDGDSMDFCVDTSFEYQLAPLFNRFIQSEGDAIELALPKGLIIYMKEEGDKPFIELVSLEAVEKTETYTINLEM